MKMKKWLKRFSVVLLAFAMFFMLIPVSSSAEEIANGTLTVEEEDTTVDEEEDTTVDEDVDTTPATVGVSFDTNGGYLEDENQIITVGSKAQRPEDPTKLYCEFAGWYEDEACTIEYDFDKPVENDIFIYAKWNESVMLDVRIISAEGEVSLDQSDWCGGFCKYIICGKEVTVYAKADDGYRFSSWKDADGKIFSTETSYTFTINSDTLLYAEFEDIPGSVHPVELAAHVSNDLGEVSYDGDYSDYSICGEYFLKGDTATIYAHPESGAHFVNWYDYDTGEFVSNEPVYTFTITKDTTLVAVFASDNEKEDGTTTDDKTEDGTTTDDKTEDGTTTDDKTEDGTITDDNQKDNGSTSNSGSTTGSTTGTATGSTTTNSTTTNSTSSNSSTSTSPKTGENGNLFLWINLMVMLGAALAAGTCLFNVRRNK